MKSRSVVIKTIALAATIAAYHANAAVLYNVVPSGGALVASQNPAVTTSTFEINDGNGFTGQERYFYTMSGGTTNRAPFTESLSFSTATPGTQFKLTTIQYDYLQFGGAGGQVSVEMFVNGNSLGSQLTPESNFFGEIGLIWNASAIAQGSSFNISFTATEIGNGAVSFFEMEGNGVRSGWTVNGDVIPEPSVALLGGLGVLALLRRRRA